METFALIPYLAAVTERIRFTTCVVKLPLRHPVLVAKQVASIAVLAENPEQTAEITVENYGQRGLDLKQQIVESATYPAYIMAGDAQSKGPLWIGTEKFEAGMRLALEAGLLKEAIPLSDLVDQSLIKEVHQA